MRPDIEFLDPKADLDKMPQTDYCREFNLSYHAFQYFLRLSRGEKFKKPFPVVKVADGFSLQSLLSCLR